jgi:hypothetical protein
MYAYVSGLVTTYAGTTTAGSNEGIGTNARFSGPKGVLANLDNTRLYVVDTSNCKVRVVTLSSGNIYVYMYK